MTYLRAENVQFDAWEELGNEGWNRAAMLEYYLAQDSFELPTDIPLQYSASYEDAVHGFKGEVDVGFKLYHAGQGVFGFFNEMSQSLVYPFNKDANSGLKCGTTTRSLMLNATSKVRKNATRAFTGQLRRLVPISTYFLSNWLHGSLGKKSHYQALG
jgi:choline dehydrogenase-like flavoprotein